MDDDTLVSGPEPMEHKTLRPIEPAQKTHEVRAELVAGAPIAPLVPRNIDEVFRVAQAVMVANAVPDALCRERGQDLPQKEIVSRVVLVIMAGSEVGLGPMASLANIALINKRRSIWGQAAVALIQSKGVLEKMKIERIGTQPQQSAQTNAFQDDFGVRVTMLRRGQDVPYVGEYTVGMAKRAHLWMNPKKQPWIEYPERQLQWRAFHIAATDGFSDCLMGLVIREVAEDLPAAPPTKINTSFLDDQPKIEDKRDESAPKSLNFVVEGLVPHRGEQ